MRRWVAGWGKLMGEKIWEGGAREVIERSWERVLDSGEICQKYRLHEHKKTPERTETVRLEAEKGARKLGRGPRAEGMG